MTFSWGDFVATHASPAPPVGGNAGAPTPTLSSGGRPGHDLQAVIDHRCDLLDDARNYDNEDS